MAYSTGAALSAAPVGPSIVMFLIYAACLLLPRFGKVVWYRAAMAIATIPFGIGGVLLNIANYLQTGLRDFASVEILVIAVGINAFGTLWNFVAAFGFFRRASLMDGDTRSEALDQ